jgi:hypothetical protein
MLPPAEDVMRKRLLPVLLLTAFMETAAAAAGSRENFACGGDVEEQVWSLWDRDMHEYLKGKVITQRLLQDGEGVALYDFQMYAHNLSAMARRCGRIDRLRQISRMIAAAYGGLEQGSVFSQGRRWTCRSGSLCESGSRYAGSEVQLYSVQFLGLAASVTNAIASSGVPLTDDDETFVTDTVQIAAEHLKRWGGTREVDKLRRAAKAKPDDVGSGSSSLFFTDKPLWMIAIYAELAGAVGARKPDGKAATRDRERLAELSPHIQALMEFFLARVSLERVNSRRTGNVMTADLDKGYWRLYPDNRYAGYEGQRPPVSCKGGRGSGDVEVHVAPEEVPRRDDTGWDLSHARRLVPALDALERNRAAMQRFYSLRENQLMPASLPAAFANGMLVRVWNGDERYPLFANYMSGANGWFRVAYGTERGRCREGFAPYGMTGAFLSGGYAAWSRYQPLFGRLGERLYAMMETQDEKESAFLREHYPDLMPSAASNKARLYRLMFLPALVGIRAERRE